MKLSAPEAIAIVCDEMHLAARAGGAYEDVLAAGRAAVAPDELLGGVADLIGEIRVEVLLEEGTRLVVLRGVGGDGRVAAEPAPGAVAVGGGDVTLNEGLDGFEMEVVNTSDHVVRVSSHFPFERANPRLAFDRDEARGARLDIPAGDMVRWDPGELRAVRLVRVSRRPAAEGT